MDCEKVAGLLDAYFDGALSAEIENALEEHLLTCEKCKAAYDRMEVIISLIRDAAQPVELPTQDFYNEVFARAKASLRPSSPLSNLPDSILNLLKGIWEARSPAVRIGSAFGFVILGICIAAIFFSAKDKAPSRGEMHLPPTHWIALKATPAPVKSGDFTASVAEATLEGEKPTLIPNKSVIDKSYKSSLEASLKEAEASQKKVASAAAPVPPIGATTLQPKPPLMAMAPTGEAIAISDRLLLVASHDRQADVIETLQRLKLNLYLSGESRFIPEFQKVELFIADIAAATEKTNTAYLDNLKIYQEAEQCLLEKDYLEAIKRYAIVARSAPGSPMAFLAHFQVANVNYERISDYNAALTNYEKCLENYPSHYISDEKKELILRRLDLLTRNSADNWYPLRLYVKAQAACVDNAILLCKELITRYPKSPLVKDAIKSLVSRIMSDEDVSAATTRDLIGFFQECLEHSQETSLRQLLQFETAELFNSPLANYPQALLEYTRAVKINPQSELAKKAKGKIRNLYRRGVQFR